MYALGGPDKARKAYETDVADPRALPGQLEVQHVADKVRWESAFDKASWR